MAQTTAERKAKQRKEMLEKGFVRKDIWFSRKSLEVIEKFKDDNNLKSYDDAINQIIKTLT